MGLRGYLFRRAINTIILILFVIILNFSIFQLLPGTQGVISNLLQNPRITDKSIIGKYQNQFGLCSHFNPATNACTLATPWERFQTYFVNMLTFNFGVSYQSGHPIFQDMIQTGRLYNTLILLGVSTVFSLLIGIFLGVFVASKRGTLFDTGWVTTSLVTYSLPTFWMGLLFILIFAQNLHWFPPGGVIPFTWQTPPPLLVYLAVRAQYLFLPALVLTLYFYGGHLLLTRATMLESLSEDYITTARAKGLSERKVLFKHALKNASLPIVTNAALAFGGLLGGAIITETVFNWDGLGHWIFSAIGYKDFPVMQAMFYIIALCVIAANFVADILLGVLDPRIKYE
ncbi:ABC transporter permease [Candidatus Bathyarchaeota archaeon]|nr:MAG: ABC transporter permease [Candidatus Bathyarchaeota archaeon]